MIQNSLPDVDIDMADRRQLLELIQYTAARQSHNGRPRPHNSGVYVTPIPQDPVLNCASLDYEEAERRGYFKIDLLNMSVYQQVRSPDHLTELLAQEPPWSRLWEEPTWAEQLVHVGGHTRLLAQMRPDSIPRMAAFISVIRPGKTHLQRRPWPEIFRTVWDGDKSGGYVFRKSHAISYALLVSVQMTLLNQPVEPKSRHVDESGPEQDRPSYTLDRAPQ